MLSDSFFYFFISTKYLLSTNNVLKHHKVICNRALLNRDSLKILSLLVNLVTPSCLNTSWSFPSPHTFPITVHLASVLFLLLVNTTPYLPLKTQIEYILLYEDFLKPSPFPRGMFITLTLHSHSILCIFNYSVCPIVF